MGLIHLNIQNHKGQLLGSLIHRLLIFMIITLFISCDNNSMTNQTLEFRYRENSAISNAQIEQSLEIIQKRFQVQGVKPENIRFDFEGQLLVLNIRSGLSISLIEKLVCSHAAIELFETFDNTEIYQQLETVNTALYKASYKSKEYVPKVDSTNDYGIELVDATDEYVDFNLANPLWSVLRPAIYQDEYGSYSVAAGPTIGYSSINDTAVVNEILNGDVAKIAIGNRWLPVWANQPYDDNLAFVQLFALKKRGSLMTLNQDNVVSARIISNEMEGFELTMQLNDAASILFEGITGAYINKSIAIKSGAKVFSCPRIESKIEGGALSITGGSSEVEDLECLKTFILTSALPIKFSRAN